MTAPELAHRHPKRGKAHRWDMAHYWPRHSFACGRSVRDCDPVPVAEVDPADLCKRCWPERAK